MVIFIIVISFVVVQRIAELLVSKKNIEVLKSEGGIEYGSSHYKYIVVMHVMFLVSVVTEYFLRHEYGVLPDISIPFLIFFAILQAARIWIITSLGKFWNTRIVVVQGAELVTKGPYKFVRHPNYIVVACEIFCLPMIFGLYYTAIVFTVLNILVLSIRIREENKALYKTP